MPNITGEVRKSSPDNPGNQLFGDAGMHSIKNSGALAMTSYGTQYSIGNSAVESGDANQINLNASWASGLFGKSGTVQPLSLRVKSIVRT